ncbi:hypothetical protein RR46_02431 [Papilio xuthus]|uniref:Uncharacterized protein n=1 Tax=Papilio xuthus TaxID=66420 RepID=A0A194PWK7_PAPXU|nr:hypothetical protein RR46_02431 [Papilio xuthus]
MTRQTDKDFSPGGHKTNNESSVSHRTRYPCLTIQSEEDVILREGGKRPGAPRCCSTLTNICKTRGTADALPAFEMVNT